MEKETKDQARKSGLPTVNMTLSELSKQFVSVETYEKEMKPLVDELLAKAKKLNINLAVFSTASEINEDGEEGLTGIAQVTPTPYASAQMLKAQKYFESGSDAREAMRLDMMLEDDFYKMEETPDGNSSRLVAKVVVE